MRILGVDPGLLRTGYGVIETQTADQVKFIEAGVVRTSSCQGISQRLFVIYKNLEDIIATHKPSVIVLEKLYSHYKHPSTSILMGHARGVACLLCGINSISLVNYSATHIKKAVTGNGRASKKQIQRIVKTLLNLQKLPEPFDISDALAIALSYVYIAKK
ncbi:MAG: crossover junction endodeoxyribonuclease RuvC [Candidatus Omnitrophota bacterium]|nr:crossover junction endodeoxyribonuclease RuvC [Candidatus Omnitrophota bacterium]MBU1894514.1 crossover junction endodeoxyribonuclease RuvC [Candidatus Omnitrophota bacterium]